MKTKYKIAFGVFFALLVAVILFFLLSLRPVSKTKSEIGFEIPKNTSRIQIAKNLKKQGIVRSQTATLAYIFFNPKLDLKAGTYTIDRSLSTPQIIKKIANGDIDKLVPIVKITFPEGLRIPDYAKRISDNFDISEDEFISKASDKKFLKEIISEYWFLEDSILNDSIYYPLEGYLYPSTYEFYKTSDSETIIRKMLDATDGALTPYKDDIKSSKYSVHDILTIASIIEKEAPHKEDRPKVSQVIYKRLELGMNLGMDVTTYYGVKKSMKEVLTAEDLAANNGYNTRKLDFKGLPIGSICNPSSDSINAALHPSDTNYVYFIANMSTKEIYFYETYTEFVMKKSDLGL